MTLGVVADMYEPDDQQFAVAFIVLSSVLGTRCAICRDISHLVVALTL